MEILALSIRNRKAEAAARQVAKATGESLTEAILHSLEDRLARLRGARIADGLEAQILDIARRCSRMPDLDTRSPDEILGYRRDGTVG